MNYIWLMKSLFKYILFALFFIAITSCNNDNDNNNTTEISGSLTKHTDCKNDLKSNKVTGTPDSLSCVEYSYNSSSGILKLTHINAGFNCCPENLYCTISTSSDTIIIQEYEQAALCRCNCLYDLEIEILGLTTEKYVLKFIEPYAGDSKKIIFEIDLSAAQEGSFCVVRHNYPWDMQD